MLGEPPQTILLAEREPCTGTGWELPQVPAELPPRQQPAPGRVLREEVGEPDAVVLAQVRLDCLAVLRQESSEACDSPDLWPQCFWYAANSAFILYCGRGVSRNSSH